MSYAELEARIRALEATLSQTVRVGVVTNVFPERATVRIRLPDADGMITSELPVLVAGSLGNRFYHLPDVGDQVVAVFLPSGTEVGFVLGSAYSQVDKPPVSDPHKVHVTFRDGAVIEYDRKLHRLKVDLTAPHGRVEVKGALDVAGGIATEGSLAVGGDLAVGGSLTVGGDLEVQGRIITAG